MPRVYKGIPSMPWTEDDDKQLIDLHSEHHGRKHWYLAVAEKLGRTGSAVQTRVKNLKIRGLIRC